MAEWLEHLSLITGVLGSNPALVSLMVTVPFTTSPGRPMPCEENLVDELITFELIKQIFK